MFLLPLPPYNQSPYRSLWHVLWPIDFNKGYLSKHGSGTIRWNLVPSRVGKHLTIMNHYFTVQQGEVGLQESLQYPWLTVDWLSAFVVNFSFCLSTILWWHFLNLWWVPGYHGCVVRLVSSSPSPSSYILSTLSCMILPEHQKWVV